ncbi:OmpA family protein [Marinicauda salina]|nr:OmpA family protein [Marinicauda salina]
MPLRLAAVIAALVAAPAAAQDPTPTVYDDGRGGEVRLPQGDISFADAVTSYEMGEPAPIEASRDPAATLGPPDWESLDTADRIVTLGCGGALTLQFTDNALIDVAGPDLFVFEVGPDVEPSALAISADGEAWIEVGAISGGRAEIDIAPHIEEGASFRFVRLTDDGEDCRGRWPGADIDAVAAIGAAERVVFDGAILFDVDSAALKPGAEAALSEFAAGLAERDVALRVEGHSDSQGPAEYNAALSRERAASVRSFLLGQAATEDMSIAVRGVGEAEPVADNATEAGRAQNRRVEIIVRAAAGSEPEDADAEGE